LSQLPPEPQNNEKNIVHICFRLPNGNHIKRRFLETDTIQTLLYFVETQELKVDDEHIKEWELICNIPPKIFDNPKLTLHDVGLKHSANLFIQAK